MSRSEECPMGRGEIVPGYQESEGRILELRSRIVLPSITERSPDAEITVEPEELLMETETGVADDLTPVETQSLLQLEDSQMAMTQVRDHDVTSGVGPDFSCSLEVEVGASPVRSSTSAVELRDMLPLGEEAGPSHIPLRIPEPEVGIDPTPAQAIGFKSTGSGLEVTSLRPRLQSDIVSVSLAPNSQRLLGYPLPKDQLVRTLTRSTQEQFRLAKI